MLIPQKYALGSPKLKALWKFYNRNLLRLSVEVIHSQIAKLTCDKYKNYFSQPKCGWSSNPYHFIIKALAERFNFTPAYRVITESGEEEKEVINYSVIFTPAAFAPSGNFSFFINHHIESNHEFVLLYCQKLHELRRRSFSIKFWFKPADLATWILFFW